MGKRINPLMKSSALYLAATAIGQGMSFAGMIVFTRIMPKADFGLYSTYYAAVAVLEVFVGANLFISTNNAFIDFRERFHAYQKTILVLSLLIFTGLFVILGLAKELLFKSISWFVLVFSFFHAYSFYVVNCGVYAANMESNYRRKTALLAIPNILQFLISLGLMLALQDRTYPVRVIGSVTGVILCAVPVFIMIMRYPGRLIVLDDWKYALKISVPSIAMSVSYMLMQQCDKMMITKYVSPEETAVYSVIFYMGYALLLFNQAVAPVRQAWTFQNMEKTERSVFQRIQKWYLIAVAFCATSVLMVAPEAIKILAPRSYWEFEYITPFVLSACLSISCGFYSELALYYKKNLPLSLCVAAAAALNIGLNFILIPRVGAVAAAYTTVAAYLLLHVLSGMIIRKQNNGLYSKRMFLLFALYCAFTCAISFPILEIPALRYPIFAALLVLLALYALYKKSEWIAVVRKD